MAIPPPESADPRHAVRVIPRGAGARPARRVLAAVLRHYQRRRFAWLFCTLLLTLGAHPVLKAARPDGSWLEVLLAINLLAAIGSSFRERERPVLLGLALAFVGMRGFQAVMASPAPLALSQSLWLAASLLVTALTARHALDSGVVDGERIFAALDTYLLMGLVFGVGYWVLDRMWPASFGAAAASDLDLARAIYFSFVTLATVGYGDIVPSSEPARGLAILEGVGGQMYLAVLVARLVSLYSRQADDRTAAPPSRGGGG
jgi:Ion channel